MMTLISIQMINAARRVKSPTARQIAARDLAKTAKYAHTNG